MDILYVILVTADVINGNILVQALDHRSGRRLRFVSEKV